MIYYIRNDVDDLLGFKYNDTVYYYIKNIQDDIIGIIDSNNNIIANYKYDSWGNIISITDNNGNDISNNTNHIANINSFRYRSYYYDTETNLYYLNSRYYNPAWGRFINADGIIGANEDILGYNLYAYCGNNPIIGVDISGRGFFSNLAKKIVKAAKKTAKKVKNVVKKATRKVSNFISSIKKSFVLDIGVGVGAGVSGKVIGTGMGAQYFNDYSLKIENEKITKGASINYELSASIVNKDIGFVQEFYHPYHIVQGDIDATVRHSNPLPFTYQIIDCDETVSSQTLLIKKKIKSSEIDKGVETSKDALFIGIDLSGHLGIGGHIKVGFNIPWS